MHALPLKAALTATVLACRLIDAAIPQKILDSQPEDALMPSPEEMANPASFLAKPELTQPLQASVPLQEAPLQALEEEYRPEAALGSNPVAASDKDIVERRIAGLDEAAIAISREKEDTRELEYAPDSTVDLDLHANGECRARKLGDSSFQSVMQYSCSCLQRTMLITFWNEMRIVQFRSSLVEAILLCRQGRTACVRNETATRADHRDGTQLQQSSHGSCQVARQWFGCGSS